MVMSQAQKAKYSLNKEKNLTTTKNTLGCRKSRFSHSEGFRHFRTRGSSPVPTLEPFLFGLTFPSQQPHLPPSHPLSMPLRASESPPILSQTCHTLHALKPSCTCIISGKTPLHILRVSCPPAHSSTPGPFWPRQSLTLSSGAFRPVAKSLSVCPMRVGSQSPVQRGCTTIICQ